MKVAAARAAITRTLRKSDTLESTVTLVSLVAVYGVSVEFDVRKLHCKSHTCMTFTPNLIPLSCHWFLVQTMPKCSNGALGFESQYLY